MVFMRIKGNKACEQKMDATGNGNKQILKCKVKIRRFSTRCVVEKERGRRTNTGIGWKSYK